MIGELAFQRTERVPMARPGYTSIIVEVYDSGHVSGKHGTRHIRPAKGQPFPQSLDVECDSTLETFPVGTRFRMDVKFKYREGEGEHLQNPATLASPVR